MIASDFEEAGSEDVIRKVTADLEGKVPSDTIRDKRVEALKAAKQELVTEV